MTCDFVRSVSSAIAGCFTWMSPEKYTGTSIVCEAEDEVFTTVSTPVMGFPAIVTAPEPLPKVMDEGAKPEMLLSIVAASEGISTAAPTVSGFLS